MRQIRLIWRSIRHCKNLPFPPVSHVTTYSVANHVLSFCPCAINQLFAHFVVHSPDVTVLKLVENQPRSQGPLSTSRKYPGYGWSRVYTCQLQTHRGWVLNKLQLQLQLSSPSLRTKRNQGTFSR